MSQGGRHDGYASTGGGPSEQRWPTGAKVGHQSAGKVDRRQRQASADAAGAINKCSSQGGHCGGDDGASCLKPHRSAGGAPGKHTGDDATPNKRLNTPPLAGVNETGNDSVVRTVEILKRPGQTLGFYIREGNGVDRVGGVFISRIGSGSVAENNALLRVGDEIVSINGINVTRTSLDDVVLLMSIAKRLVLKLRTRVGARSKNAASCPSLSSMEHEEPTPVVVLKGGYGGGHVPRRRRDEPATDVNRSSATDGRTTATDGRNHVGSPDPLVQQHMPARYMHHGYTDGGTSLTPAPGVRSSQGATATNNLYITTNVGERTTGYTGTTGDRTSGYPGTTGDRTTGYTGTAGDRTAAYAGPTDARSSSRLRAQDPNMTFRSPQTTRRRSPYACLDYASDTEATLGDRRRNLYGVRCVPRGIDSSSVRAFQDEIERTHHRYEQQVGTRQPRNGCTPGHRTASSPDRYNSDSEVHTRNRKWTVASPGSGKEARIVRLNQSLPHVDGGESTEELKHWLKKFDNLSYELAGSDNTKAMSVSPSVSKGSCISGVSSSESSPSPAADAYTSEEYWSWLSSNSACKPAASRQVKHRRQYSVDSLMDDTFLTQKVADLKPISQRNPSRPTGSRGTSSYAQVYIGASGLKTSAPPDLQKRRQHGGDSSREVQRPRKPLEIRPDDFRLYHPDMEDMKARIVEERRIDGLMNVRLYCGHGLKSSKTVLRDLYCVLELDSVNKARTMIRTGAINFDWDEEFDVDLHIARELSFLVYSWDPNTRHRLCFSGTLALQIFLQSGNHQKIALKLEPKGILYLELIYKEAVVTLQRTPSLNRNDLFAVDLETIIKRERSSCNVPIVVKKCIEEVDRRGLDHVGIYRLCGSAKRKKQLKDDFTRNPRAVDLSAESVSDINVVTGVLKDFLRELPEPLFTNALYHMLLDALNVRLPEDPSGSARLMLSVLECLPKPNQDTMELLLDHLKRVAVKANTNKMTTQNLAVCFGPVLLCPSLKSTTGQDALDFRKHIEVLQYLLDIWPERTVSKSKPSPNDDGSEHSAIGWEGEEVSSC